MLNPKNNNDMSKIDEEKASKAQDYIYSGKVFEDGVREEAANEPQDEKEETRSEKLTEERSKRLDEARDALFSGKLFK